MNKIDLIMWTYNSEKTLPITLLYIDKAIPEKFVNRKIMIDGGSSDNTENCAGSWNWEFFNCKKGIPYQANMGLNMVETKVFASFEHDIILCKDWYVKIKDTLKPKNVAVSQGVRLNLNKTMRAIEQYGLLRDYLRYTSIDNNLYKTAMIKDLGGFNVNFPASCDRELQDRVRANGLKWLVNKNIVSAHIKLSLREMTKHVHKLKMLNDYQEDLSPVFFYGHVRIKAGNHVYLLDAITKFLSSFFVGAVVAKRFRCPAVSVGFPYWRLCKLRTALMLFSRRFEKCG